MTESPKFTDRAAELAAQAAAAAGPLKNKATGIAAQAAAAAAPVAAQARDRATVLATQAAAAAGPLTAQARERAAQGVEVLADNLDKLTGGKYSDQIGSVTARLGGALSGLGSGTSSGTTVDSSSDAGTSDVAINGSGSTENDNSDGPTIAPVAEPTHFQTDDVITPQAPPTE